MVIEVNTIVLDFISSSVGLIAVYFIFKKLNINQKYLSLAVLMLVVHFIGVFYAYDNVLYYDKVLHSLNAIFITLIVFDLFSKDSKIKYPEYLICFLAVVGIFTIWEIYEYLGDVLFNFKMQGVFDSVGNVLISRIDDTMQDLIVGSISALITIGVIKLNRQN